MRTVSGANLEWRPYPGQRALTTETQPLLEGTPGAPDNFEMYLIRYGEGGSHSPRHRHNFDQFRWAFDKPLNFSPNGGDIAPREVGYFPEGTYYGPQNNLQGTEMLIIQFGAVTGSGYMSNQALRNGTEELKTKGEFARGIYTSHRDDGTKFNKDAYEAVWEHVSGRKLDYPVARYTTPIVLRTAGFPWRPVTGHAGVERRSMGTLNERGTAVFQLRLADGATYAVAAQPVIRLLFVVSGALVVDGMSYGPRSAIGYYAGDAGSIQAQESTVLAGFVMPDFSKD